MQYLDPKAVWLFSIHYIITWLIPAFIVAAALSSFLYINIWITMTVFLAICVIASKTYYHFYRYELADREFKLEKGIIYKQSIAIPYDKIQNIEIRRGILSRILGLSELAIQTAGINTTIMGRSGVSLTSTQAVLPGILEETAQTLQNDLIARAPKI